MRSNLALAITRAKAVISTSNLSPQKDGAITAFSVCIRSKGPRGFLYDLAPQAREVKKHRRCAERSRGRTFVKSAATLVTGAPSLHAQITRSNLSGDEPMIR